ncbi:MAG: 2-C-methyl-D-erythritol 4-phosphate cytidylyltransferase [Bacteroidales bacterium]|nr:2-C-methyl-D-erythritol 4-phosphate cytidylyltransferase [Bacteroidales bacterium]
MQNIAVILAGGTGSRMGSAVPKQFLPLGNRTVIEYSIDRFCFHPAIDEVAVVIHPDWRAEFQTIVDRNRWPKLGKVVDGGSERYMSTLNALMAYIDEPDDTNLLLHDAARPMVSTEIIDRVVKALGSHEAVGVAVPSTDTVWEVHPDMNEELGMKNEEFIMPRFVARIPERKLMWRAQTPQAFRLPLIRDAYQRALQDPRFQATDDCGVVRKYMPGTKICVVEGSEENRKITFKEDLTV